jgi:cell division protein FtsI (penicillin-binding protein 3)
MREQIVSKKTIAQVQKVLQNVVEIGSAKVIKNPYFSIAGKTGTAQVLQVDKKTYKDKSGKANYYSSFVGYFPAESPKYSIFVAVSEPTKGYYSSEVAAPIFRQIAYPLYAKEYPLDFKPNLETLAIVPDFPYSMRGKLQDILTIYQHLGFKLQLEEHLGEWAKAEVNKDQIKLKNIDDFFEQGKVPAVVNMGLRDALYLLQKEGLKVQVLGKMGRVKQQSLVPGTTIQKNMSIVLQLSTD